MAEPEELVIEGAHAATRVARAVWRRYGPRRETQDVALQDVRARLEMFATALFERPIAIAAMQPPAPVTFLARLAGARPDRREDLRLLAGTDGQRVYLPESCSGQWSVISGQTVGRQSSVISGQNASRQSSVVSGQTGDWLLSTDHWPLDTDHYTIQLYQLLTAQQSARLVRGTADGAASLEGTPARDWFLLAEAALVDRWIALEAPGLCGLLSAVRAAALEARAARGSSRADRDPLERQIRESLASDPRAPAIDIDPHAPSRETLAWARARAASVPGGAARLAVPLPWYWGRTLAPQGEVRAAQAAVREGEAETGRRRPQRVAEMRRRPRARDAAPDEDDRGTGTWVIRADEPQESVEDPWGLQRPADRDDGADPEGLADSLSDLPEARVVRTPGQAREVLRSGEDVPRVAREERAAPASRGLAYPEWDYRSGCYREPGAIVRTTVPAPGDEAWAASALVRHGALVRRVRARFERLRPRNVLLGRQPDGSEVDIDAFVTTVADLRAGTPVHGDGRMYLMRRPARRELAVALLVDVSASTDAWVAQDRRVVEVEKEALLVVCEALDALGDRYGIFAFSGEGPEGVAVVPVKAFDEPNGLAVRRRIAALDSDRYTRMGAPIRHVTAALCRERSDRRLLLILSDGKPNDVDLYEGRYGVEDTRQAVAEARRQGVAVFCVTVDREAPRYASRIFGRSGYSVLRRAEQLPAVLIEVLRGMVRGRGLH